MRKWTAQVSVAGQDVTSLIEYGTSDTLAAVTVEAITLAKRMIRDEEMGSDGSIVIFKQLKGQDEPQRDRSMYVYRDWDRNGNAVIRTQAQGA
jgi:hypothetical protein